MRIFALALPFLLLGACEEEEDEHSHTGTETGEMMTDNGLYMIHLTPSADPYGAGVEVELDMHIMVDDVGVPGATVSVTPFMPDMGHGIDTPPTVTEGDMGMYTAAWTFSMSGLWELDIEIDGSEGTDMVTVSYEVE